MFLRIENPTACGQVSHAKIVLKSRAVPDVSIEIPKDLPPIGTNAAPRCFLALMLPALDQCLAVRVGWGADDRKNPSNNEGLIAAN